MGDSRKISCFVNGKATELETDPNVPLLHVLREALGLKATRFGCGEATCGACTVIVDGRPVMSCDMPVGQIDNCRIETADGLAGDPTHPLVSAFLDHQAGQCGYCLPGILMTAKALLSEEPTANRERIAAALDGNLCRCGAHARILDAIEDAAARLSVEVRV